MALPANVASTTPLMDTFRDPYERFNHLLIDYEEGGIALNDGTQGLEVQIWELSYISDEEDPNYGDFILTPEDTGPVTVFFNVPDVTELGLAFDQNMNPFICYYTKSGECKFYWYDSLIPGYTTTTLPAGSRTPCCCLDDHRVLQTGTSDIIMAYLEGGFLRYRQQRDRYTVVYTLGTGNVGARLLRVGMMINWRLGFDVQAGGGGVLNLAQIVGDLCVMVDVTAFDVSILAQIPVRGFISAGLYTSADAIRSLQLPYFFDFPEVDAKLLAVLRGGDVVATIPYDDVVLGHDLKVETGREQGVEYPRKLHVLYEPAETDYTPTKATSERRSPSIKVKGEFSIPVNVNFEAEEVMQRSDVMHKVLWTEMGGTVKWGLDESYARLVPSDPVNIEIRPTEFRRVRITQSMFAEGVYQFDTILDRQSDYESILEGISTLPPSSPPPTIASLTTWEFMDLPALIASDDYLHYHIAGYGDITTAWNGAQLQREIAGTFENESSIVLPETMGDLDEALPFAPADYTDTTNTILVTTNEALESITDDQLLKGSNAFVITDGTDYEILQFRDAVDEAGSWRLSHLLRGRLNTTPRLHAIATRFVMLGAPIRVLADVAILDTVLKLRMPSFGELPSTGVERDVTFTGRSQTEWAPQYLTATKDGNDWVFTWVPRWRLGNSANPVKSVHFAGWRMKITVGPTTVQYDMPTAEFTYTSAQQGVDFGGDQSTLDIELMGLNQYTGEGDSLVETV